MPDVICEVTELSRTRPTRLAESLSVVSSIAPHVEYRSWPHEFILVAKYGQQISESLREWKFPSSVPFIDCRYIERWLPVDASYRNLRLRNAYFHLDQHRGPDNPPKEVLAFHWEPILANGSAGEATNLDRPHLHFSLAPQPLHRSHFVVTLTVPSHGQASVDYLNELLEEVIRMVGVEVLSRISDRPKGWEQR